MIDYLKQLDHHTQLHAGVKQLLQLIWIRRISVPLSVAIVPLRTLTSIKDIKKNIKDHSTPITPPILYERSHTYDWSIRACLVDQS